MYKSGYWHSENDSLDEILRWNQNLLSERYGLVAGKHPRADYKHMLFDFGDFSEVRLILIGLADGSFSFYLSIPEEDFFEYGAAYGAPCRRLEHRMDAVRKLVLEMWHIGGMSYIQTAWECSEVVTVHADILDGVTPAIEPFAIVPEEVYRPEWDCTCEKTGKGGVILRNDHNWFYL